MTKAQEALITGLLIAHRASRFEISRGVQTRGQAKLYGNSSVAKKTHPQSDFPMVITRDFVVSID